MVDQSTPLPTDIDALHALITAERSALASLIAERDALAARNDKLERIIRRPRALGLFLAELPVEGRELGKRTTWTAEAGCWGEHVARNGWTTRPVFAGRVLANTNVRLFARTGREARCAGDRERRLSEGSGTAKLWVFRSLTRCGQKLYVAQRSDPIGLLVSERLQPLGHVNSYIYAIYLANDGDVTAWLKWCRNMTIREPGAFQRAMHDGRGDQGGVPFAPSFPWHPAQRPEHARPVVRRLEVFQV